MTYTCLIIEDERPAIKLLTAYVEKIPHLQLLGSFETAMDGLAALKKHRPQILFLDIQMPEITGLDLLKMLQEHPQVIMTTAYRDFAVEGFSLNVTDYLVKPFSFQRFVQAVDKAIDQIGLKQKPPKSSSSANKREQNEGDHFFVRTNYKMEKINFQDILYLESMREYVSIHTKTRRYVVNQTMNKMQETLPAEHFMRVHRSFIVGLRHIQTINGNMIVMGDKKITIGPSYRKAFFDKIHLI